MALDPQKRAALLLAKLRVLAASVGADGLTPLGFPGGAAAFGDGVLWVLGDNLGASLLGPAVSVALRPDAPYDRLVVITDSAVDAAVLARRATEFAHPARIDAASVNGTTLAFCEPISAVPAQKPSQKAFEDVIVAAGAEAVWEHGILRAEVRGLEIARVEDGELAVGVGKHDREGHRMANPDQDPVDALRALVARVLLERTADAPSGLMTSLSRERWLRSIIVGRADLVGATSLTAVEPPLPRGDLRATSIAPAIGTKSDGSSLVVACSVGVDPDLLPSGADVRATHAPDGELVLVVPESDALPSTYRLAVALKRPARVVTVPANWPAMGD